MRKNDELSNFRSCFNKARSDEMLFVLRGQDRLAPWVVRIWALMALFCGCHHFKVQEAWRCAAEMAKTPNRKVPD